MRVLNILNIVLNPYLLLGLSRLNVRLQTLNGMVINGLSQPVSFTVDANLPLAKTRKRNGCDNKATIKRAHKIPLQNLYLFLGLSLLNIRLPYGTEKAESLPCDKSKEGKEEPN